MCPRSTTRESDEVIVQVVAQPSAVSQDIESGLFFIEFFRRGRLFDWDFAENTIVNSGLIYIMGSSRLGVTPITSWFVGFTEGTPVIAVSDNYAGHPGWVEETSYDETTRQPWVGVAGATPGEATNAASRVVITVAATGPHTFGGVFMCGGGASPSVKGDTAGGSTLLSVAPFSMGNRVLNQGDLLRVTYIQRSKRP